MKNTLRTTDTEAQKKLPAQLQAGSTRRDVVIALGAVVGCSALTWFLSSLPDERNFQEAELEIVKLSSKTKKGDMNPARNSDSNTTYTLDPTRRFKPGNQEKYIVSLRLPDGTIDSREVPEDVFKKLKQGDKILCKYLIRYDGMQLVTEVLPRVK